MPVLRSRIGTWSNDTERLCRLRVQLLAEWSGGQAEEPRPDIVEELNQEGRVVHVCVIWDSWQGVDDGKRSEMIMDAFVEKYGLESVMDVNVAMGLTPLEAKESARARSPRG